MESSEDQLRELEYLDKKMTELQSHRRELYNGSNSLSLNEESDEDAYYGGRRNTNHSPCGTKGAGEYDPAQTYPGGFMLDCLEKMNKPETRLAGARTSNRLLTGANPARICNEEDRSPNGVRMLHNRSQPVDRFAHSNDSESGNNYRYTHHREVEYRSSDEESEASRTEKENNGESGYRRAPDDLGQRDNYPEEQYAHDGEGYRKNISREFKIMLRKEIEALDQVWFDKLQSARTDMDREREFLNNDRRKFREEVMYLRQKLDNLTEDNSEMQLKMNRQMDEKNGLESRLETNKTALTQKDSELSEVRKRLNSCEVKQENSEKLVFQAQQSYNRLKQELAEANNIVSSIQNKNKDLENQMTLLTDAKNISERTAANLQADNNSVQVKYEASHKAHQSLQQEHDALLRETRKTKRDMDEACEMLHARDRLEKSNMQKMDNMINTERELREEIRRFQQRFTENESAQRSIMNYRAENETVKSEAMSSKEELTEIRNENRRLEGLMAKMKFEVDSLSNDLYAAKQESHSLRRQVSIDFMSGTKSYEERQYPPQDNFRNSPKFTHESPGSTLSPHQPLQLNTGPLAVHKTGENNQGAKSHSFDPPEILSDFELTRRQTRQSAPMDAQALPPAGVRSTKPDMGRAVGSPVLPAAQTHAGSVGQASTESRQQNEEIDVSSLEKQLTLLNLEKNNLDSAMARQPITSKGLVEQMFIGLDPPLCISALVTIIFQPFNLVTAFGEMSVAVNRPCPSRPFDIYSGRTIKERQERERLETRLNEVESAIHSLRRRLKKR